MTMREVIDIVEGVLREQARAPLYHCCGFTAAIAILQQGAMKPTNANYNRDLLSLSRDERYRYSGAGYGDENGNSVVEAGHGPIQFVFDQEAVRSRFKVRPFDMAITRFDPGEHDPDNEDGIDEFGGWSMSGNARRKESEEQVKIPPGKSLPLDDCCKAIILEPVTNDWLRAHHLPADREHLVGAGREKRFPFSTKRDDRWGMDGIDHISYDSGEKVDTFDGFDYTGVSPRTYARIIGLAKQRGIPIVDRRKG